MGILINLVWSARRRLLHALRWPTRGVKVAAFAADGGIVLIRNRYGRTDQWVLPGGGVGWREDYAAAAARELAEETRLVLRELRLFAAYTSTAEGKRDTVELYVGRVDGDPVADGREVAEARVFALAALPDATSPATRRRIAELTGAVAVTGRW